MRFSILIFLLMAGASMLWSNPFLGSREEQQVPSVRPPGSASFLAEQQLAFKATMADLFTDLRDSPSTAAFWGILGLAFLYGLLHSAGPGHRKTVVFSLFMSRKANPLEPLLAALVTTGAHAGSALVLVLAFQLLFSGLRSLELNKIGLYLEGFSFLILALASLFLIIRSLIFRERSGHSHGTDSEKIQNIYTTLLISGLFPCPGVIMILSFAAALNLLQLGILAVIAVSLGMATTISFAAYLAYFGRVGFFRILKTKEMLMEKVSFVLELGSYTSILLFSLWMVLPFITGLFRNIIS